MADLLGLATAAALGISRFGTRVSAEAGADGSTLALLAALPLIVGLFGTSGLYGRDETRTDHTTVDDLPRLAAAVTGGVWGTFVLLTLTHAEFDAAQLVVFWAAALCLVTLLRGAARASARRSRFYTQNTVILGAGQVGCLVGDKISNHPEYGLRLLGFIDADPPDALAGERSAPVLGGVEHLTEVVRNLRVERVIVAFSRDDDEALATVLKTIRNLDVQVDIVPRLFDAFGPHVSVDTIEGLPLVGLAPLRPTRSALLVKRAFDVAAAACGLLLFAPVFLAIIALLRLQGGPVFYRGQRIGRGGSRVAISKFRTMDSDAERMFSELMRDERLRSEFERSHKLAEDPRVTRLGAFLRKTSLDELPQLLDVLAGRLSSVGPRPMTAMEWDQRYGKRADAQSASDLGYWVVEHLRPGLTGYWQINGRSKIAYSERLRLDMAYLSNWSLKLDVVIVAKTLRALIAGSDGAY